MTGHESSCLCGRTPVRQLTRTAAVIKAVTDKKNLHCIRAPIIISIVTCSPKMLIRPQTFVSVGKVSLNEIRAVINKTLYHKNRPAEHS